MKNKMFTIYDSKAELFLQPFCYKTEGQAIRGFSETINDPQSQIFKYPDDYTLYEIGVFDDDTGTVESIPAVNHGVGLKYVLDRTQSELPNMLTSQAHHPNPANSG